MRFAPNLSIEEIRKWLAAVQGARADGRPLTTDEERFMDWLLVRVSKWPTDVIDFMNKLTTQVQKLDFSTEAARTLMLADIAEYPLMTPDHRQRAKDRLYRALTAKPPDEGQQARQRRMSVSGHGFDRPTRFGK